VVSTVVPRVLDDVEPLCRFCKKPARKACKAAVLAVGSADDDVDEAADPAADDVPVLELPEVLPPSSAINFENAVFNAEIALDDTVDGAPSAEDESVMSSLLPSSVTRDASADVSPLCA
jgi:hypothetical protein